MRCRWTKFAAVFLFLLTSFSFAGYASAKDKDKDKKDSGKPSARSEASDRVNAAREQAAKAVRNFENRPQAEPKALGNRNSNDEPKFKNNDAKSSRSFVADQKKQNSNSPGGAQPFGAASGNRNRFDNSNNSNNPARSFTPSNQPSTGNPNVRSFPSGGNPSGDTNTRSFPSGNLGQGNKSSNPGFGSNPGGGNIRPYQPNDPTGNAVRTLTPNTINRPKVVEGFKPDNKPADVTGEPKRTTGGFGRTQVGGTPFNPNPTATNKINPTNPSGPKLGDPVGGNPIGNNPVGRLGGNTPRVGDTTTDKPNYQTPGIVKPGDPRFDRSRIGNNDKPSNDPNDKPTFGSNDKPGKKDKPNDDGPTLGDGRGPIVNDSSGRPFGGKGPDDKGLDFDRDGKPGNRVVGDSNRFYDHKRDENHVHHESKIKDVSKTSWAKRIDGDRIDRLAVGAKTEKLKLDKQFELQHRGDVARQMNLREHLHNHGGWDKRPYYGPVSASYRDRSFHRSYCGPSWYPNRCWYPSWNSWVNWSWYFNVPSIWDPRPVYCRPIVYQPAVAWVYYPYPAWQPLPMVASGTWVDVPQTPVERDDLQLLAVRFVDPGHPGNDLGARYRVWVRNNSTHVINDPFNVVVMGTRGQQVTDARLEAGVRVPSIEPGQILPIDIRLPLNLPSGDPIDFDTVHVLVDSHRELNEVDKTNNGAVLARGDIEPVDPAVFSADADVVLAGAVVNLAGEGLGPEPGEVILQIGDQQAQVEVVGWYDLGVQVRIPQVALGNLTGAELMIVRGDGAASNPLPVQMASSDSGQTY